MGGADCIFLASKVEKMTGPLSRVRPQEDEEKCVIDIISPSLVTRGGTIRAEGPVPKAASLEFEHRMGRYGLVASDIPVRAASARGAARRRRRISTLIDELAQTCDVEDVHKHRSKGIYEYHFHLSDCSLADLRRVLKEAGY